MDQTETLLISSYAWTLSTELIVAFLREVLCEKALLLQLFVHVDFSSPRILYFLPPDLFFST